MTMDETAGMTAQTPEAAFRDMTPVVVESPYAGRDKDPVYAAVLTARNMFYLRACMAHCFSLGEVPYASHAIYTQPGVLDDAVAMERLKGMIGGFIWGAFAQKRIVYADLGITRGMREGVEEAKKIAQPIVERRLPGWPDLLRSDSFAEEVGIVVTRMTDSSLGAGRLYRRVIAETSAGGAA